VRQTVAPLNHFNHEKAMKTIVVVCSLLLAVSSAFAQDPKEEPKAEARPVVEMKPRYTISPRTTGRFFRTLSRAIHGCTSTPYG
jgi:hypothetical protein